MCMKTQAPNSGDSTLSEARLSSVPVLTSGSLISSSGPRKHAKRGYIDPGQSTRTCINPFHQQILKLSLALLLNSDYITLLFSSSTMPINFFTKKLQGKRVVIIGGTSGIGFAVAREFHMKFNCYLGVDLSVFRGLLRVWCISHRRQLFPISCRRCKSSSHRKR